MLWKRGYVDVAKSLALDFCRTLHFVLVDHHDPIRGQPESGTKPRLCQTPQKNRLAASFDLCRSRCGLGCLCVPFFILTTRGGGIWVW